MIRKRYFKNYLRSLVPLTAVVALIFLVLHLFEIFMFGDYGVNAGYYSRIEIVDPGIAFLLYLASIYALFLPIHVLRFRYSRAQEDILYSLPLSRKDLILLHGLSGYISLCASYTVAFLIGVLVKAMMPNDGLFFANFIPFYLVALLVLLCNYCLGAALALVAKNVLDAVLLPIAFQAFFFFFFFGVGLLAAERTLSWFAMPLLGVSFVTAFFNSAIGHSVETVVESGAGSFGDSVKVIDHGVLYQGYSSAYLPAFILMVLFAFLVIPCLLLVPEREKSEESGQPSQSWLGLRSLLPLTLLGFSLFLLSQITKDHYRPNLLIYFFGFVIADVVYFVLDMVRRRQVRPKWENLVFVAISLAMFAIAAVVPYAGEAQTIEMLAI